MFVQGPRLVLSVREYHAELMVDSDAEASMNSIKHSHYTNTAYVSFNGMAGRECIGLMYLSV